MRRATLLVALGLIASACASASTVRGVVLEVDGDLEHVRSFTLRADGGEIIELVPAEDGTFEFPLTHLQEHRRTLTPVEVEIERRDGVQVAVSIADAGGGTHHSPDG